MKTAWVGLPPSPGWLSVLEELQHSWVAYLENYIVGERAQCTFMCVRAVQIERFDAVTAANYCCSIFHAVCLISCPVEPDRDSVSRVFSHIHRYTCILDQGSRGAWDGVSNYRVALALFFSALGVCIMFCVCLVFLAPSHCCSPPVLAELCLLIS